MINTVAVNNIGQTGPEITAYGLFVHPSEALQNEITKLVKNLEVELPGIT